MFKLFNRWRWFVRYPKMEAGERRYVHFPILPVRIGDVVVRVLMQTYGRCQVASKTVTIVVSILFILSDIWHIHAQLYNIKTSHIYSVSTQQTAVGLVGDAAWTGLWVSGVGWVVGLVMWWRWWDGGVAEVVETYKRRETAVAESLAICWSQMPWMCYMKIRKIINLDKISTDFFNFGLNWWKL